VSVPDPGSGDRAPNPWYATVEPVRAEPKVSLEWPPVADPKAAKRKRRQSSGARSLIEWVAVIAGALLVAVLIRTLFLQTFWIPSESMETTLLKNDRVLVNKLSYKIHDVHRGDVVVFKRPPKEPNPDIKDLIKRVIALPGETVQGMDCKVVVDGQQLEEPYVDAGKCTTDFGPVKVSPGQVWVMGDNRPNSQDSRVFGAIDQSLIVGRAFVKIWPLGRLGWL
jgi:signal peptidase I